MGFRWRCMFWLLYSRVVQVRRENGVEVDLTLLPVGKHHLMMWVGCMTFSTEGVYCEEVQTLPAEL